MTPHAVEYKRLANIGETSDVMARVERFLVLDPVLVAQHVLVAVALEVHDGRALVDRRQ